MRPARLISGDRLAVVLVAHGSRDPRAAASTEALARAVRRAHPGWAVRAAYLDHAGPRPLDVLASLPPGRRVVVVPLLLTAAYHGRVDIPAVLAEAAALPLDVTLADVLGPLPEPRRPSGSGTVSSLLLDGLTRRLSGAREAGRLSGAREAGRAGPDGLDAVVLAAAGTRHAAARETIKWAADALSARLSLPCAVAYASAAPPAVGDAVALLRAAGARRVGMAAYFLAPGFLYDLAARSARAAGAVAVADPLGDAPELVRLVATRVDAAAPLLAPAA